MPLKLVVKNKDGSEIHNNINSFINSQKKFNDALLPITSAFGINIFEFALINQIKKILFVEGEADIYTIKIAYFINGEDYDYFVFPLLGKNNTHILKIINLLKYGYKKLFEKRKYKILFDSEEDVRNFLKSNTNFKKENVDSFSNLTEKFNNPEDILSVTTKEKYKIEKNHKTGWQSLCQDIISKKYELSKQEKDHLIKLSKKIEDFIMK